MALSTRLAASCWIRRGSPSRAAGWMSAWTCRPRRLIAGRAAASAALVMAARSAGSRSPGPASLLARVSSASMRCSCSALEASRSRLTARQVLVVAAGSARVTWSRVRSRVSGVRSSCEALAANRRCASKEASSRANRPSRVSASSLSSSSGPCRASRSCRLLAEIRRAAAVIVRNGRSTCPAMTQPIAAAATAMTARAMAAAISSCGLSRDSCLQPPPHPDRHRGRLDGGERDYLACPPAEKGLDVAPRCGTGVPAAEGRWGAGP